MVSAVSQVISALERFIDEGTEVETAFKALVAKLARHNYDRLGSKLKMENRMRMNWFAVGHFYDDSLK